MQADHARAHPRAVRRTGCQGDGDLRRARAARRGLCHPHRTGDDKSLVLEIGDRRSFVRWDGRAARLGAHGGRRFRSPAKPPATAPKTRHVAYVARRQARVNCSTTRMAFVGTLSFHDPTGRSVGPPTTTARHGPAMDHRRTSLVQPTDAICRAIAPAGARPGGVLQLSAGLRAVVTSGRRPSCRRGSTAGRLT